MIMKNMMKSLEKSGMKSTKGGVGPGSPKDKCDIFGKKGGMGVKQAPGGPEGHVCCGACIYSHLEGANGQGPVILHCHSCGKH